MPAAPSGPSLFLYHTSCPGALILPSLNLRAPVVAADAGLSFSSSSSPCLGALIFSSFNLLAGFVYGDCAVRFLSGEKGRIHKKQTLR